MFFTDRELLDELMLDAKQYSLYAGTYLEFVHTRSRNNPPEHNLIYVGPENFMHLVGIESDTCTAIDFYKKWLTPITAATSEAFSASFSVCCIGYLLRYFAD